MPKADTQVEIVSDDLIVSTANPLATLVIAGGSPGATPARADSQVELVSGGAVVGAANPVPIQIIGGIPGSVPTGTPGAVAFWNAGGTTITEDDANFHYDDTANNLVLGPRGSLVPGERLSTIDTVTTASRGVSIRQYNTGAQGANLHLYKARGTPSAPTAVALSDILGQIVFGARAPSGVDTTFGQIWAVVDGNPSGGTVQTALAFGTGQTGTNEAVRIDSNQSTIVGSGVAATRLTGSGGLTVYGSASQKTAVFRSNATTPGNILELQDSAGAVRLSTTASGLTSLLHSTGGLVFSVTRQNTGGAIAQFSGPNGVLVDFGSADSIGVGSAGSAVQFGSAGNPATSIVQMVAGGALGSGSVAMGYYNFHSSSNGPSVGGIVFRKESRSNATTGSGSGVIMHRHDVVFTDVTAGSVDADVVEHAVVNGTITEHFRYGAGRLAFNGTLTQTSTGANPLQLQRTVTQASVWNFWITSSPFGGSALGAGSLTLASTNGNSDLAFRGGNTGTEPGMVLRTDQSLIVGFQVGTTALATGGLTVYGSPSQKTAVFRANATTPGNIAEFQNSGGTAVISISKDGIITGSNSGYLTLIAASAGMQYTGTATSGDPGHAFGLGGSVTHTSGTRTGVSMSGIFAPTSGTGVLNFMQLIPTINQTGGANGITRALYINPTITAAADFRALEVVGSIYASVSYFVAGTKVIGAQGAAVADAAAIGTYTGVETVDKTALIATLNDLRSQLNAHLARDRAHGLIAT